MLDKSEIKLSFIRAPGPGGQNVNKVATAVQLRFDITQSPSLSDAVKARLITIAGNRVTNEGVLVLRAHEFRTQERNKQAALDKLFDLIAQASHKPKPRKKTKPSFTAKKKRLDEKKQQSQRKTSRRKLDKNAD